MAVQIILDKNYCHKANVVEQQALKSFKNFPHLQIKFILPQSTIHSLKFSNYLHRDEHALPQNHVY